MLIHSALRSIPFLQGLPDAEIDWLTLRAGSLHLARGEELFHPGDPVEFAYFLRTGAVALTVETGARTGTVTGLILPTDVLNIIAWTPGAVNLKTATAVVDTDLIAVAAGHLQSCPENAPELTRRILQYQGRRNSELTTQIQRQVGKPVSWRVAETIRTLWEALGNRPEVTQYLVAGLSGATREAAGDVLREFQRRGWLRTGRGRLEILDPQSIIEWQRAQEKGVGED